MNEWLAVHGEFVNCSFLTRIVVDYVFNWMLKLSISSIT
jgi:hypothetical protein